VEKIFARIKSMRLAIGLISYFAIACLLATLVPQGLQESVYFEAYPKFLALLIVRSGFSRFFSSFLFIMPSFLFFANLGTCAVARFIRELRKKDRRRHGPDILHLGLLLLLAGAVLSFSGRRSGFVLLGVGDTAGLPDGRALKLTAFDSTRYEDGRPKDWVSTVTLLAGDDAAIESFPIRVNHPLKLGGLSIYQSSHSTVSVLELRDPAGDLVSVAQGDEAEAAGARISFMAADDGEGRLVLRVADGEGSRILRARLGESAGPFALVAMRDRELTGLEAVSDPGYGLVLAALALSAIGVAMTFIQKLGDMKP
jgi:hypothetical protein